MVLQKRNVSTNLEFTVLLLTIFVFVAVAFRKFINPYLVLFYFLQYLHTVNV